MQLLAVSPEGTELSTAWATLLWPVALLAWTVVVLAIGVGFGRYLNKF